MKFEIPKIIRPLSLQDYAPELDTELHVWVNPPRDLLNELFALNAAVAQAQKEAEAGKVVTKTLEEIGEKIAQWYVTVWSQGEDKWTLEDVQKLIEFSMDTDPGLWPYMTGKTTTMIFEHRTRQKKG